MEIGGCDITLEGKPPSKEAILAIVQEFWPNLVVEDDESEYLTTDYFVYKNQKAKAIWESDWEADYDADMMYFLPQHDCLTVVIDNDKKLMFIVDRIKTIMETV